MELERLLLNPERFRCGDNYHSSSNVFPVEFEGVKYIAKKQSDFFPAMNLYYVIQDKFLFGTRKIISPEDALENEYNKLKEMGAIFTPYADAFDGQTLIREYIDGTDFRNLPDDEKWFAIKDGFDAMECIHDRGFAIGDAHVKNTIMDNKGQVFWLVSGAYDESNMTKAKAADLLKFVYSTYTATRNLELTLDAAQRVSGYNNEYVLGMLRTFIRPLSAANIWFPTRVSNNVNNQIKEVLLR